MVHLRLDLVPVGRRTDRMTSPTQTTIYDKSNCYSMAIVSSLVQVLRISTCSHSYAHKNVSIIEQEFDPLITNHKTDRRDDVTKPIADR